MYQLVLPLADKSATSWAILDSQYSLKTYRRRLKDNYCRVKWSYFISLFKVQYDLFRQEYKLGTFL